MIVTSFCTISVMHRFRIIGIKQDSTCERRPFAKPFRCGVLNDIKSHSSIVLHRDLFVCYVTFVYGCLIHVLARQIRNKACYWTWQMTNQPVKAKRRNEIEPMNVCCAVLFQWLINGGYFLFSLLQNLPEGISSVNELLWWICTCVSDGEKEREWEMK